MPKESLSVARFDDLWQHQDGVGGAALNVFREEKAPLTFAVSKCRAEPAKKTFEPGNYDGRISWAKICSGIVPKWGLRSGSTTICSNAGHAFHKFVAPMTNDRPGIYTTHDTEASMR